MTLTHFNAPISPQANRHSRLCVGPEPGHHEDAFCDDVFSAALKVANLTTGHHSMRTWVEGSSIMDVVVASDPFEVEVSKDGPYHVPPEAEESDLGIGDVLMEDEQGAGLWSDDKYRETRSRSCGSSSLMMVLGIKTSAGSLLQRQAIRQTWLHHFR